jgi:hypothetical protein
VAAILITVLSISKATALPVYAAGLAAGWLYLTLRARRLNLRAPVLGLMVAATYTLNFLFVLRGGRQGMTVDPGGTFRSILRPMLTGVDPAVGPTGSALLIVSVALLIGWLMPAVGALLIRRELPRDPMAVMLFSGLIAASAAVGILYHFSQAQIFFARSGFIYGVLVAAWGLSSLERKQYYAVAPALLLGAAAIYFGRAQTDTRFRDCKDTGCLDRILAEPLVAAAIVAAVGIVVIGLLARGSPRTWAAIAVAAAIGMTVSPTIASLGSGIRQPRTAYDTIAPGGLEAARFIRAHSEPDELIATNIHCLAPGASKCHSGSFWIPGYAERRVLVEGWGYTAKANDVSSSYAAAYGAFWDQEKLQLNDAALDHPTAANLEVLRTKYGVSWVLYDERLNPAPARLERLADLRFRSGTVRVYELYPSSGLVRRTD